MYENKIMHRDLKLENVLIQLPDLNKNRKLTNEELSRIDLNKTEFIIKIADLGFSRVVEEGERALSRCGTALHMAPEMLFGKMYDFKIDVWSLGCLFFSLLTGKYIYDCDNMRTLT